MKQFNKLEFPIFDSSFPSISKYRCSFKVVIDSRGEMNTYTVELIGPFIFSQKIGNSNCQLTIFLPNYLIQSHPGTKDIRLIPYKHDIQVQYLLIFKSEQIKKDIYSIMMNTLKAIPSCNQQIEVELHCMIHMIPKLEGDTKRSMIIGRNSLEFVKLGFSANSDKINIGYYKGYNISTLEGGEKTDINAFNSFKINLSNSFFYVELSSIDEFMFSFISLYFYFQKWYNQIYDFTREPKPSPALPCFEFQLSWGPEISFISKTTNIKPNIDYKNNLENSPKAKYYLPEKTSNNLEVVKLSNNLRRTLLFCDKLPPFKQLSKEKIKEHPDISIENEKELIFKDLKDELILKTINYQGVNNDQNVFSFEDLSNSYFFSQNSSELFQNCFDPLNTKLKENIVKIAQNIGLFSELKIEKHNYFGSEIIFKLNKMIDEFNGSISMNDERFCNVIDMIVMIVLSGSKEGSFIRQIKAFLKTDFIFETCDFNNMNEPSPRNYLYKVFVRLLIKKQLSRFISICFSNYEWKKLAYSVESYLTSIYFFPEFVNVLEKLEDAKITGKFIIPSNLQSRITIPFKFDFYIRTMSNKLLIRFKGGEEVKYSDLTVSKILILLYRFLLDGYIPTTQYSDIWDFIKNVPKIKLNADELRLYQQKVDDIDKKRTNSSIHHISELFIEGIRKKVAHMWFLCIAKAASTWKTHKENSLVYNSESIIIIAESLDRLSYVESSLNQDNIIKYLCLI